MEQYDVIVVGAGLGGLQCAYMLSKSGYKVLVLEQGSQVGGCLQNFRRGNALFDTGFHYVGGLDEGRPLHRLFDYYGLLNLPWVRLDDEFDHILIGDKEYAFAQGHDNFVGRLAQDFPNQKDNLIKYDAFLANVGRHIFDSIGGNPDQIDSNNSLFARSAYQFLNETITDPQLRKVLSGTSLKMQLDADTLPLYVFAQINNSFIEGAYRLKGGGQQIADKLVESIRSFGGDVLHSKRVTRLIEEEGIITRVEVNDAEQYTSKWVISNSHPVATLDLLKESHAIRKIYRNRMNNLRNSFGTFTVNIRLKPNVVKYRNSNLFIHDEHTDLWRYSNNGTIRQALVSMGVPADYDGSDTYAEVLDIITPMSFDEVSEWADSTLGHRPEAYKQFKAEKAEALIKYVTKHIPELNEGIDKVFTSTPLSYKYYTSTAQGSAYGVMKNFESPMTTVLTPKTPIRNLLLTGQNLNLHGILGVSMTSSFTCAEILGIEKIKKELSL